MERTTCCVVGGGPAGMMLGLLLARAGVEVTVLEKHRDFLRDFRGDTIHPSTLRLLDELGLGRTFAGLPARRLEEMQMKIGDHTVTMADFRYIPGPHKYVAMVPQWDFLNLLADAASAEPSFTLRMRTAFTALRTERGRVTGVHCVDEDGVPGEIAADLVVACDGRDSLVRQEAGLRPDWYEVPMDVWQVRVPIERADSAKAGRVFGQVRDSRIAVTMDRGDYYQTSYLIAKGSDARLRARGIQWFRDQLGELFGWDGEVTDAIESWEDVKLLEVTMGRLPRWYRDGLLCIGDSAHTMSPVGGVGVNLAVQDAVAAARILAGPLRRGAVGPADLARVQKRRWLPMAFVQKAQLSDHRAMHGPVLNGTFDTERLPAPFRLMQRVPALRGVAGYLGGIGIRPERAPEFARRPQQAVVRG
ncbi:FAD-dependent oxidoreductase [Kitasatospora sp. GP82]|uniref:FAD-dependent oxidoreductase n=1 Tax=Kitasatospora sp. GP82 TaxID=3035089 RepID=UPI0024764B86|nr:FAD-dependent oxidoreductase [Kitasatospora sp. GP82]MDH6124476.1 2-polyprenyl-6-methoxyphenol hydroxylase-like FAD-dependent oxidoreductase [Kitasatospora sp. GP82]